MYLRMGTEVRKTFMWKGITDWRKNPYPLHGRSLEICSGGRLLKIKILEAKYEAKLEFSVGVGDAKQKPVLGGVWIFSGTAQ